jgi:hypothetical protein
MANERWPDVPALTAFGAVVLGAGLRFHGLDSSDLSGDETFSWCMVQLPVGEMLRRLGNDVHPPLYYLALKLWCSLFGDSIFALRGLSALFGTLTIVAVYRLAPSIDGPTGTAAGSESAGLPAGAVAALLLAVSPFHVTYSRVVRMYAMGDLLAAWSTCLLVSNLRSPRADGRRLGAYALAAAGLLATHYYGFFTVAAHGLAIAAAGLVMTWRGDWGLRRLGGLLASAAAAALLYLPWLPSQLRQMRSVWLEYWIPRLSGADILGLISPFLTNLPWDGPLSVTVAATWGVVLLAGLVSGLRPGRLFLAALILAPWVGGVGIAFLGEKTILLERYLIFSHLFYLVALAVIFTGGWPGPVRAWLLIAFLAGSVLGLVRGFDDDLKHGARGPAEALVRKIARVGSGRRIIVGQPDLANLILYHAARSGISLRVRVLGDGPVSGGHLPYSASVPEGGWLPAAEVRDLGPAPITAVIDESDSAKLQPLSGRRASSAEIIDQPSGLRWHLIHYDEVGRGPAISAPGGGRR